MDYAALYSKSAQASMSAIRLPTMAPVATDLISFAVGQPDPLSMPLDDLLSVSRTVLWEQTSTALLYGAPQGEPRLRGYVADRLNEKEGLSLGSDQVAITAGSSQAIGLLAQLLIDPGETILLEGPTFLGAARTFRVLQARLEELPLDQQGLQIEVLERRLAELQAEGVRPKFLYTMPTFHNPTGVTMPLERRLALLEVARRHQLLVIEDDAYGDLRFEGSDLPSLLALDRDGLVVRLGTFSKILAAGTELVPALTLVKVDGGTNPYGAHVAAEWALSGRLEPHVELLRGVYRERRDALLAALERYCSQYCSWTRPEGGFFVWLELQPGIDPQRLREAAHEHGVAYLPGPQCFASGKGEQYLRLSFSYVTPERIEEGMKRLGRAMAEARGRRSPESRVQGPE
jgi:2-aminoadipate transaminase